MQPLLNLKSFLAILLVLAIPGALLVAYFRNYSPEGGTHEHAAGGDSQGMEKGHDMTASGKGDAKAMPSHDGMAAWEKSQNPASMEHNDMKAAATAPSSPMEESGPPAVMHIGAKGFFIDRPQTFTPRADQAKTLADIKERSAMDMMASDKRIQEAEQSLWKLTASDSPDLTEIEAKAREVEKLRADQRVAFIRAVAEAANLLTPEQKETLLRADSRAKPAATQPAAPAAKAGQAAEPAHKH